MDSSSHNKTKRRSLQQKIADNDQLCSRLRMMANPPNKPPFFSFGEQRNPDEQRPSFFPQVNPNEQLRNINIPSNTSPADANMSLDRHSSHSRPSGYFYPSERSLAGMANIEANRLTAQNVMAARMRAAQQVSEAQRVAQQMNEARMLQAYQHPAVAQAQAQANLFGSMQRPATFPQSPLAQASGFPQSPVAQASRFVSMQPQYMPQSPPIYRESVAGMTMPQMRGPGIEALRAASLSLGDLSESSRSLPMVPLAAARQLTSSQDISPQSATAPVQQTSQKGKLYVDEIRQWDVLCGTLIFLFHMLTLYPNLTSLSLSHRSRGSKQSSSR